MGGVVEDDDPVLLAPAGAGHLHGANTVAGEQRVDVLLDEVGGLHPLVSGLRRDDHEIPQVEPARAGLGEPPQQDRCRVQAEPVRKDDLHEVSGEAPAPCRGMGRIDVMTLKEKE